MVNGYLCFFVLLLFISLYPLIKLEIQKCSVIFSWRLLKGNIKDTFNRKCKILHYRSAMTAITYAKRIWNLILSWIFPKDEDNFFRIAFQDKNLDIINKKTFEERQKTRMQSQDNRPVIDINARLNEKIFEFYNRNFIEKNIDRPFVPWLREDPIRVNWTFDSIWSQHEIVTRMTKRSSLAREKCKKIGLASHSRRFKVYNILLILRCSYC